MRYTDDNNKRLIKVISERSNVGEHTTSKVIQALSEYIQETLLDGEGVQITPIGKLEGKVIQPKETNLLDKDGKRKRIKKQRRITFTPSKEFRERLILE